MINLDVFFFNNFFVIRHKINILGKEDKSVECLDKMLGWVVNSGYGLLSAMCITNMHTNKLNLTYIVYGYCL